MASRPEAAYAAAEVTPKWVLISWHHLLSPSDMIAGGAGALQLLGTHVRVRAGSARWLGGGRGGPAARPGAGRAVWRARHAHARDGGARDADRPGGRRRAGRARCRADDRPDARG